MSLLGAGDFEIVRLRCECRINGELLYAEQTIPAVVYDDPQAREAVQEAIRRRLMMAVLDKWKPKIQVRR